MKKLLKYMLYFLGFLVMVLVYFGIEAYRNIGDLPDGKRFEHLPYYKNGQFVSPEELVYYPEKITGEGGWISHKPYAPKSRLPMETLTAKSFGKAEEFAYYWLGHSSAILEIDHRRILIDPVFDNAAPVSLPFVVSRFQEAPIKRKELPHIDIVLITHDHYDHLEAKTIRHLADKAAHFVTALGVGARLQSWGVPAEKITELGWGDLSEVMGIKISAEPAVHYSARWRDDRNKTLWASFVLGGSKKKIYWSGDSGYGKHFAQIGEKYGKFDLAFIEIDAANPGWANTHLFPEQAVQSTLDVKADILVPIHWGVFNLGRNPWKQSITRTFKSAQEHNVRIDVPIQGQKYHPENYKLDEWWAKIE